MNLIIIEIKCNILNILTFSSFYIQGIYISLLFKGLALFFHSQYNFLSSRIQVKTSLSCIFFLFLSLQTICLYIYNIINALSLIQIVALMHFRGKNHVYFFFSSNLYTFFSFKHDCCMHIFILINHLQSGPVESDSLAFEQNVN